MTSIKPPRDDEGVVRRQLQRAGAAAVGKLRRSAPGAAPRPAGAESGKAAALAGRRPRRERGPERRADERRGRHATVLLDTRSTVGNRRRRARRGADQSAVRSRARIDGAPPAGTVLDDDVSA
jgi:hypothetical protein